MNQQIVTDIYMRHGNNPYIPQEIRDFLGGIIGKHWVLDDARAKENLHQFFPTELLSEIEIFEIAGTADCGVHIPFEPSGDT